MTANQMILLLQIYRGSDANEHHVGTYKNDVDFLLRAGYVEINRNRLFTTARGTKHIRHHVLQEMQ